MLLIANATVSFNMICSAKQLKSNYVIRNNDKTPQHKKEIANAIRFREDVEMNILYRKEQHLNQRISYLNMDGVYQYEGIRENFKLNIDENLCRFVQLLYQLNIYRLVNKSVENQAINFRLTFSFYLFIFLHLTI